MLEIFLGILLAITACLMIGLVLLHSGRGGGLSDMFGGASGAALGSTAAERNLNRITLVVAIMFIMLVVSLGLMLD